MKTILIVDDEEAIRKLITEELTDEGYRVLTAASGMEALEKVAQDSPDLIVMDIKMPGMDGFETIAGILNLKAHIPIIILTAYSSYRESFMAWAADEYVVKSCDLNELKAKIKKLLELSEEDNFNRKDIIINESKIRELTREIDSLKEENKKLKEMKLVRIKSFFELEILLHGWVHDFKNNVVTFMLMTEHALKKPNLERLEEVRNTYNKTYKNMENKIQQLYEYLDYGVVKVEAIEIIELVKQFIKSKKGIQPESNIILTDHTKGKLEVMGNKNQIYQVLDNIVNNAVEASPKGSTITIYLEETTYEKKNNISIIITDEGSGIPASIIEQLNKSIPLKLNKMGLGLPLSKYLIERHGGRMDIKRLPKGTEVIFEIPTIQSANEE